MGRSHAIIAAALALSWGAGAAHAQVDVSLDPDERARPSEPPPQPAPQAAPQPIVVPVPEGAAAQEEDTGFFLLPEDLDAVTGPGFESEFGPNFDPGFQAGPVPLEHEVRPGDTLWDICYLYFNNPWEWPKIWSYNPEITNPHWIYPGDRVRLYPDGDEVPLGVVDDPQQASPGTPQPNRPQPLYRPPPRQRSAIRLRRFAFVDEAARKNAFTIVGSVVEKSMLAEGDSVFLEYSSNNPPEVGKSYTIYTETREVTHPTSNRTIGRYVRVLGDLTIQEAPKGQRARGLITDSTDVIERGTSVGPLPREFAVVAASPNQVELAGVIVALFGDEQLIGQNQVVFIDKGEKDGVVLGNTLTVIRRGDAYGQKRSASATVGQDDRRFPDRTVGEIRIVQVGERVSAGLVTLSLQEIGVGDMVQMDKTRSR
ncbi:LysM peptidoglycan-binding domain-containing protein [Haliangium sp.]|uniref:LysM peptidoglycan-binding domain-containing protein n=1 Tax=Haliangium sp. TaxID=2663208 RepID=UPI003D141115